MSTPSSFAFSDNESFYDIYAPQTYETTLPDTYDDLLLAHLPVPCSHKHTSIYDALTFSFLMLPSVNRKFGTSRGRDNVTRMWVKKQYQLQEEIEGRRIAAQRARFDWLARPTDRYLICYVFSYGSNREDIHNPLKPTCDLFGPNKYTRQGKKKPMKCIPCGNVIYNDNRVQYEMLFKRVEPKREAHWAVVTVYKYHEKQAHLFPVQEVIEQLAAQYANPLR